MSLQDALRDAIGDKSELEAREPEPDAAILPSTPEPGASDWARALGEYVKVPPGASRAQLEQLTGTVLKQLKKSGKGRDAKSLKGFMRSWTTKADKQAWSAVKRRFDELRLPDKAYRRLKQERAHPERVLKKLYTRAGRELEGASAARAYELLSKGTGL